MKIKFNNEEITIADYSTDMNDFACEPISHSNACHQRDVIFYVGNCKVYYLK